MYETISLLKISRSYGGFRKIFRYAQTMHHMFHIHLQHLWSIKFILRICIGFNNNYRISSWEYEWKTYRRSRKQLPHICCFLPALLKKVFRIPLAIQVFTTAKKYAVRLLKEKHVILMKLFFWMLWGWLGE